MGPAGDRMHWGALGGRSRRLKLHIARPALAGVEAVRNEVAGPPHHRLLRAYASRLLRQIAPDHAASEGARRGHGWVLQQRCQSSRTEAGPQGLDAFGLQKSVVSPTQTTP